MLRTYTRRPLSLRLDNVVEGKTEMARLVDIDPVTPMSIHNMLFANLQQAAYLMQKFGPVTLPGGA